MAKSVAILIIGSLIWDDKTHRRAWRQTRLDANATSRVRAPIRYGRMSDKRANTYTMVFSNQLVPERLGIGLAVPCRCSVNTAHQLFDEAEALWAAEQASEKRPGPLAASWGAVGLLCNPESDVEAYEREWSERVAGEHTIYRTFPAAAGETAAVAADGKLTIPWPTTELGKPLSVDLVLATATVPHPFGNKQYATSEQVAAAWNNAPGERKYFEENRRFGITTAFDEEILRATAR